MDLVKGDFARGSWVQDGRRRDDCFSKRDSCGLMFPLWSHPRCSPDMLRCLRPNILRLDSPLRLGWKNHEGSWAKSADWVTKSAHSFRHSLLFLNMSRRRTIASLLWYLWWRLRHAYSRCTCMLFDTRAPSIWRMSTCQPLNQTAYMSCVWQAIVLPACVCVAHPTWSNPTGCMWRFTQVVLFSVKSTFSWCYSPDVWGMEERRPSTKSWSTLEERWWCWAAGKISMCTAASFDV